MFRAHRALVLAICVLFVYGAQLSAALAAPPQGLPPCQDDHPAHVDLSHIPPCQQDQPPEEVPPVEEAPVEEPSTDPPASNDLPPCTEDHPAVPDLSDLPPCQVEAEDPPADEPPAEVPPVEEPPAEEPSTDQPASNDLPPCTEDHPAVPDLTDLPPCQGETPGAEPPLDEEQPAPPAEPLSEEPQQPSAVVVSEVDVSTEEPPSEELVAEELVADELVAEDPPATQTPADQPGTSLPADPALTDPDSADDLPPLANSSEPAEQDPREVPIELTTRPGGALTIDISDFVHEAGAFTTLAHVPPTNGTLSVAGLVATYTPNPGFYGVDAFTLRVCDSSAVCLDISASVTVPPINDFLLTTGAALAEFFSGGRLTTGTYNDVNLLPTSAQRVVVPLAGLAGVVGASLMFGLDSVGSVFRRWLAVLAVKS